MSVSREVRVVFLGPPGAGKGTQARLLDERFGARAISTGDLLRRHRRERTVLGLEAQSYMEAGKLVPDALVLAMMEGEIATSPSFVLDGFPRTQGQARALDGILERLGRPLDAVVLFELPRARLLERLLGRWTNPRSGRVYHEKFAPPQVAGLDDDDGLPLEQRSDDRAEAIERRLAEYDAITAELIPYYEARGLLRRIDAALGVDEVSAELFALVERDERSPTR